MKETNCCDCGVPVRATDDDDSPRCESCQGEYSELMLTAAILRGEYKHLLPVMFPELADDDEVTKGGEHGI
jgi:hypothetical protein